MASPRTPTDFAAEAAALGRGQTWQPPSGAQRWADRIFRRLCLLFAALTIFLIVFLVVEIGAKAVPAFREYGLGFLHGTTWDPNKAEYGILPEIWGTLYTSLLALVIGSAFGVAAAIFLRFAPELF
jgi:phosphate transport system permease protein